MPRHLPYVNPHLGYYYFRPYNALHVAAHQREVGALGGDPRDPYDNRGFQAIYREVEAGRAPDARDLPASPPVPAGRPR
jgi:hypothetical protein